MKRLIPVLVAVALTAVACGGGGGIEIGDAWARTSASMQNAGAVYMTISADDEGDTLTGVSVDSSVAAVAELHETTMSDDDSGTMMMQEVVSIEVPTSGEVSLEPGGYHVMLMQLAEPLVAGNEFTVTLSFENAGDVDVNVEVRDS
jgi:copper(I)-binding protein